MEVKFLSPWHRNKFRSVLSNSHGTRVSTIALFIFSSFPPHRFVDPCGVTRVQIRPQPATHYSYSGFRFTGRKSQRDRTAHTIFFQRFFASRDAQARLQQEEAKKNERRGKKFRSSMHRNGQSRSTVCLFIQRDRRGKKHRAFSCTETTSAI